MRVGLRVLRRMAPKMPNNLPGAAIFAGIMSDQNQHTVSRFYLKQFTPETGDKILWQYGRDGTGPTRVSPRHATAEIHFYSVQRADGTWDDSLEKALAEIEQKAAPAVKRLTRDEILRRGDREAIACFIGLLLFRVSAIAEHAKAENARLQSVDGAIQFLRGDRKNLERFFSKAEVDAFEQPNMYLPPSPRPKSLRWSPSTVALQSGIRACSRLTHTVSIESQLRTGAPELRDGARSAGASASMSGCCA